MRPTLLRVGLAVTAASAATFALATPIHAAPSPDAVISEVYGGGGNSGATLTRDFIELANAGARRSPSRLQRPVPARRPRPARCGRSPSCPARRPRRPLPRREAAGTGGTVALPTAGRHRHRRHVRVRRHRRPRLRHHPADLQDRRRLRRRHPRSSTSSATAVRRRPRERRRRRNSANATVARGTALDRHRRQRRRLRRRRPDPGQRGGRDVRRPGPATPDRPARHRRIHDIQGTHPHLPARRPAGHRRPRHRHRRTHLRLAAASGSRTPHRTPTRRTSEGIFVYTGSAPRPSPSGDAVLVSGTVAEYTRRRRRHQPVAHRDHRARRSPSSPRGNALPAPVVARRQAACPTPTRRRRGGGVESTAGAATPATYALDYYESLEGMRVQVADARVVGATTAYAELWVTAKPRENPHRPRRHALRSYDRRRTPAGSRSSRSTPRRRFPTANVGDVLTGATAGVAGLRQFGGYTLLATDARHARRRRPAARGHAAAARGELAVATYNVENLDAERRRRPSSTRLAAAVVDQPRLARHRRPGGDPGRQRRDQRRHGRAPTQTLKKFTDAIVAAGGPATSGARSTRPTTPDGGEPGGNIRGGFLFNPERVSFVDRPGGDATTAGDGGRRRARQGRADASPPAGSTRPTRPGTAAASRWPASSASAAARSS